MSERTGGIKYSSLYGIKRSNGVAQFGLGGDSTTDNYAWTDLLCDSEVAYGVVSLWINLVLQHYTNRC